MRDDALKAPMGARESGTLLSPARMTACRHGVLVLRDGVLTGPT